MRATDYIADEYRSKIAVLLEDCGDREFGKVTWKDSLKHVILNDSSIRVEAVSANSFDVYCEAAGGQFIDVQVISSARIADFVVNARRVKQQYKTATAMSKVNNFAAPWVLVSVYYSSFFAANELLRLNDHIPLSLDTEEYLQLSGKVFSKSAGICNDFLNASGRNYVGEVKEDRITYSSTGARPHQAAWQLVGQTLSKLMKEKGWVELRKYIQLANGQNGWVQPSDLRNSWNYKRADLYSNKGQQMCKHMFNCLGDFTKATDWFALATPYDETTHCSALSAITEFLVCPILSSYDSLFGSEILI